MGTSTGKDPAEDRNGDVLKTLVSLSLTMRLLKQLPLKKWEF